jgi:hypothetical protein
MRTPWVRQVASILVYIRLRGLWILNGPALGVPELERRPVARLSTTRTSKPFPNSASTRCEPMKPAPPVTSIHPGEKAI